MNLIVHQTHYFLACGKSESHYICCDPYYHINKMEIEIQLLLKLTKKAYNISKCKTISINRQNDMSVDRSIKMMHKSKVILSLNKLLDTLMEMDSLENEYYLTGESDFWLSTFYQAVGYYIPGGRLLFASYLEEINIFYKNECITDLQEKYNFLYKHWITISNLLMKSYMMKNYTLKKETIINMIKHAVEYEKKLMISVISCLSNIKITEEVTKFNKS